MSDPYLANMIRDLARTIQQAVRDLNRPDSPRDYRLFHVAGASDVFGDDLARLVYLTTQRGFANVRVEDVSHAVSRGDMGVYHSAVVTLSWDRKEADVGRDATAHRA